MSLHTYRSFVCPPAHPGALLLLGLLLSGLASPVATAAPLGSNIRSSRSVVLPVGRSILLHFQRMKRVEVIEPELADVVVASLNDLSLYGKKGGETTVYIWDMIGIHQLEVSITATSRAEALVQSLRNVLGPRLTYTTYGDSTVIVEGTLPGPDAERARSILLASEQSSVRIVNLVRSDTDTTSGATAIAEALRRVLGDKPQYTVWNDNTVLVQGTLGGQAELDRARRLLVAAGTGAVKVVDLLEVDETVGQAPVEDISRALGDRFRVWQIQGRAVAVEGTVSSAAEAADVGKILETFGTQAKIVNLVRVVEPRPDINTSLAMLQQLVGTKLSVRPLNDQTLALEGTVATDEDLKRVRDTVAKYPVPYQVVDLLRVALPEKRQIICHVRVVDINKAELSRLGVNWGQLSIKDDTVSFVDQPWLVQTEGGLNNMLRLGAQIDALATDNRARILAEPNLMVDDGGKANMLVGGELPIPLAQSGGGGVSTVTVEWKQYGVLLDIEPKILESGDKINVRVAPEVSSLDFTNGVTISGFVLPALRTRKASTVVTVADGEALVIGGLLSSEDSKVVRKIPLLGDLPIIGKLFTRKEFQTGQTELIIMVTPEIVDRKVASFR